MKNMIDMDAEVATAATLLVTVGGMMSLTVLFVLTAQLLF